MKGRAGQVVQFLEVGLGFNPRVLANNIRWAGTAAREFRTLKRQAKGSNELFPMGRVLPCLGERNSNAGAASGHYFWQDLIVAQRVYRSNPVRHVDVGSRIDGFVAHVASFRPVEVVDIRNLPVNIPNVKFRRADLMSVPSDLVGYCDSLSCLHALEHLGLGRYGDRIDFEGHLKGFAGLSEMLSERGTLYLSVPIGPQRIEFNAHRVFSIGCILRLVQSQFSIVEFSYVDDVGNFHENEALSDALVRENAGCWYGCGIFVLQKR